MSRTLKNNVSGTTTLPLNRQHAAFSGKVAGLLLCMLMGVCFLNPAVWGQEPEGKAKIEGKLKRPQAQPLRVAQVSPELNQILKDWEKNSGQIQSLEGDHERYIYDQVFGVEKRTVGHFWYKAPDQGRIDFEGVDVEEGAVNPKRRTKDGKPFKVQSGKDERWICTGKKILQIDDAKQTCGIIQIPPESQGQNITNGPLPFLFGMEAKLAKRRYRLEIGDLHNPEKKGIIHLIAFPNWKQDAANWQKAEVLLNAKTYVPWAIKLIDPSGNQETVYKFSKIEKNKQGGWLKNLVKGNPFDPNLNGYKKNLLQAPQKGVQQAQNVQPRRKANAANAQGPPAQGPQPKQVGQRRVPSLIGLDWKKARKVLKQVGYEAKFVRGKTADREELIYVVYQQNPAPKTALSKGNVVTLTLYTKGEDSGSNTSGE